MKLSKILSLYVLYIPCIVTILYASSYGQNNSDNVTNHNNLIVLEGNSSKEINEGSVIPKPSKALVPETLLTPNTDTPPANTPKKKEIKMLSDSPEDIEAKQRYEEGLRRGDPEAKAINKSIEAISGKPVSQATDKPDNNSPLDENGHVKKETQTNGRGTHVEGQGKKPRQLRKKT